VIFLNRTDAQDTERKRESEATVLETDEATGGVCCSLKYLFRCVFDSGVDSFGQVCRPILKSARSGQYQTVYAQRLGAIGSNSWATLYATVTKPIAGTAGHLHARWSGGRFDRCRWRTLRPHKMHGSG